MKKVSSLNRFCLFFSILLVGSNPGKGEGPASRESWRANNQAKEVIKFESTVQA
jgi:hypothetical protein